MPQYYDESPAVNQMHAWAGVMPSNVMNEGFRIYKEAQKMLLMTFTGPWRSCFSHKTVPVFFTVVVSRIIS